MPTIPWLLLALLILSIPAISFAQVGVSITIGPPALPVYEQPLCPAQGYLWRPGYWAYDYNNGDYNCVPGTWVMAPQVGFLWTQGVLGLGQRHVCVQ
jgi:WXXGXW repeat (2 copies)